MTVFMPKTPLQILSYWHETHSQLFNDKKVQFTQDCKNML